ncbi:MAG: hypothetical protein J3K34DRAFT_237625 [Monoraphidium minutum]|nr:MAG: hypothetical protein J3K34DRAFT_237625 [Monoraphidium minutum]
MPLPPCCPQADVVGRGPSRLGPAPACRPWQRRRRAQCAEAAYAPQAGRKAVSSSSYFGVSSVPSGPRVFSFAIVSPPPPPARPHSAARRLHNEPLARRFEHAPPGAGARPLSLPCAAGGARLQACLSVAQAAAILGAGARPAATRPLRAAVWMLHLPATALAVRMTVRPLDATACNKCDSQTLGMEATGVGCKGVERQNSLEWEKAEGGGAAGGRGSR